MKIEIEFKPVEKLTDKEIRFMNTQRNREYGKGSEVDFKKEDKKAVFIFVRDNSKIKAFGMLKPVKLEYKGKHYEILGVGRGMAVEKGKEYGRLLNVARIYYLKKTGKSAVAFTGKENFGFFKKAGFKTKSDLIRRFRYKDPITGKIKIDNDGGGVYYEGKDEIITNIIKGGGFAYTNVDFW